MNLSSRCHRAALAAAVCVLLALQTASGARPGDRIGEKTTFTTSDGVRIACLYKAPAGREKKTFILLHGLGSNQEEWQPFAHRLAAEGYGFLSYDARGHGESTRTVSGRNIHFNDFGAPGPGSAWEKMISDLDEAVRYLSREKKIPAAKTVLAGASVGANVCIIYGAANPAIPAVIALSPGLNYVGFGTQRHITAYAARPIAIAVSPEDTYSYQSGMILFKQIDTNRKAALFAGNKGHGVQMLNGAFDKKLLQWVRNVK